MVLASVDPGCSRNDFYTTAGNRSTSLTQAAHKQDPTVPDGTGDPAADPLNSINWPTPAARESFWAQMIGATGDDWAAYGLKAKL